MSKNSFYFSHDNNARNDDKILAVRMELGAEGYGIYFMLLEKLLETEQYILIKDYNRLAFDLRVSSENIKKVVENFGLFAFTDDGKRFYSESLLQRMKPLDNLRKQRSEAGKASAEKRKQRVREAILSLQKNSTTVERPLHKNSTEKVKESKVNVLLEKEPKYNNNNNTGAGDFENQQPLNNEEETLSKSCGKKFSQKFTPPTPEEVQDYCNERQNGIKGQEFCDYYQSKGWMIGKNKMKDWKAAVRTWERYKTNDNGKQSINHSTATRATTGKGRKISAHQLLAKAINQPPTRDNESGNITIEAEIL